jgi:hypothetical protein
MIAATPPAVYAAPAADYQMFSNDTEPDCTVAAAGDLVIKWDAQRGVIDTAVVNDVQHTWHVLGAPSSGVDPATLLNYWTTHTIDGYRVHWTDQGHASASTIRADVAKGDGAYVQVHFSAAFMQYIDTNAQATWTTQGGNGANVDTHQIDIVGYSTSGVSIATWGETYHATWQWLASHETDVADVAPIRGAK